MTGGGGFIGKNLLELLGGKYEIDAPNAKKLNLLDNSQVRDYFKKQNFDAVIHCAAVGSSRSKTGLAAVYNDNGKMFLNVAENLPPAARLIFLGSGAEYGKQRAIVKVKETDFGQVKPEDEYGKAKYFVSEYILQHQNIVSLRCFGVFGKYEDYTTRFISNAICRSLAGLSIVIRQNLVFSYVYVNDLAKIISKFIDRQPKEKFYNVGREEGVELLALAKIIQSATGGHSEIQIQHPGMGREYTCDNTLLMGELPGFEFTSFEQAIAEMTVWYKNNWQAINKSKLNFDV